MTQTLANAIRTGPFTLRETLAPSHRRSPTMMPFVWHEHRRSAIRFSFSSRLWPLLRNLVILGLATACTDTSPTAADKPLRRPAMDVGPQDSLTDTLGFSNSGLTLDSVFMQQFPNPILVQVVYSGLITSLRYTGQQSTYGPDGNFRGGRVGLREVASNGNFGFVGAPGMTPLE